MCKGAGEVIKYSKMTKKPTTEARDDKQLLRYLYRSNSTSKYNIISSSIKYSLIILLQLTNKIHNYVVGIGMAAAARLSSTMIHPKGQNHNYLNNIRMK